MVLGHPTTRTRTLPNTTKALASLAVDPDFKGKGIASKLVKWGIGKAEEAGMPAYLESSPAAVAVYRRLGFKELRKLNVIRNNESHPLTVMIRPSGSAEV
jgi:predicted N-acetyltransferase YhbS